MTSDEVDMKGVRIDVVMARLRESFGNRIVFVGAESVQHSADVPSHLQNYGTMLRAMAPSVTEFKFEIDTHELGKPYTRLLTSVPVANFRDDLAESCIIDGIREYVESLGDCEGFIVSGTECRWLDENKKPAAPDDATG